MPSSSSELEKELNYYKQKLDELSGESVRHDYMITALRGELKQKKDAFSILTSLQKELTVEAPLEEVYSKTVKAICTSLAMDRALVLTGGEKETDFQPTFWYGYQENQLPEFDPKEIDISDFFTSKQFILFNRNAITSHITETIKTRYGLNYFVGVPVWHDGKPVAFLFEGRQMEKLPFSPPLNKGDADTLMAIASLISTLIQNKKMVELRAQMKKQKEENTIIAKMLAELKSTQAQLIQSEKMASLGELTAGIAHEIQNPLNFVNNFSEVNDELLKELKAEAEKGNLDEVKAIASDISLNSEKINQHGKRADAIVKGMLQHSRTSSGQKELTDINALADEYLRLAYHGLRAKNKSFNAKFETDLDKTIEKINVVPQDIGRVILNLINNAFYAVDEKKKLQPENYDPKVTVSTKAVKPPSGGLGVSISVKDNGNGIPRKVFDKIFQPFFTTKPTGQGTGLGLSLSYDIIKAHGGEIKVKTKENEGSEFIIILPVV